MYYKWLGPYTIIKSLGKGLYALKAADNPSEVINRVHGTWLKPYLSPLASLSPDVSWLINIVYLSLYLLTPVYMHINQILQTRSLH